MYNHPNLALPFKADGRCDLQISQEASNAAKHLETRERYPTLGIRLGRPKWVRRCLIDQSLQQAQSEYVSGTITHAGGLSLG